MSEHPPAMRVLNDVVFFELGSLLFEELVWVDSLVFIYNRNKWVMDKLTILVVPLLLFLLVRLLLRHLEHEEQLLAH